MDLAIVSETILDERDFTWLASDPKWALTRTQTRQALLTDFTRSVHYPNGRLKRGLVIAQYTSGSNQGYMGPFIDDNADGEGLAVEAAIVVDGFTVRYDRDGNLESNTVAGAVVLAGIPIEVFMSKMPANVLDDGTTADPVDATVLSNLGFVNADPVAYA